MPQQTTDAYAEKIGYISAQIEQLIKKVDESTKSSDEGRRRLHEAVNDNQKTTLELVNRVSHVETRVDQLEPFAKSYSALVQRWKVWVVILGGVWIIGGGVLVSLLSAFFAKLIG